MAHKKLVNGNYLKWFHQIEKELWSLFSLFGDLCGICARDTLAALDSGERKGRDAWCCCMIDNQVHDNWDALDAVQTRFDRNWYEPIKRPKGARSIGHGPCPALGDQGCRLKKCRPITCTTQLCSKMLNVLKDLKIINKPTHAALQIEDLIDLPDIMPDLYGTRKGGKVSQADVDEYISAVRRMKKQFKERTS